MSACDMQVRCQPGMQTLSKGRNKLNLQLAWRVGPFAETMQMAALAQDIFTLSERQQSHQIFPFLRSWCVALFSGLVGSLYATSPECLLYL